MNKFALVKESFTWSSGRPAAEVDMGTSLQLLSLLTEAMQKNTKASRLLGEPGKGRIFQEGGGLEYWQTRTCGPLDGVGPITGSCRWPYSIT